MREDQVLWSSFEVGKKEGHRVTPDWGSEPSRGPRVGTGLEGMKGNLGLAFRPEAG